MALLEDQILTLEEEEDDSMMSSRWYCRASSSLERCVMRSVMSKIRLVRPVVCR